MRLHFIEKVSTAITSGPDLQEIYTFSWWFMWDEKMLIVGFPYLQNFLQQRLLNFHSTASSKFPEKLPTSVFVFQECMQLITRYFVMYTKPMALLQFLYKSLIWSLLYFLHRILLICYHILLWHVYSIPVRLWILLALLLSAYLLMDFFQSVTHHPNMLESVQIVKPGFRHISVLRLDLMLVNHQRIPFLASLHFVANWRIIVFIRLL